MASLSVKQTELTEVALLWDDHLVSSFNEIVQIDRIVGVVNMEKFIILHPKFFDVKFVKLLSQLIDDIELFPNFCQNYGPEQEIAMFHLIMKL